MVLVSENFWSLGLGLETKVLVLVLVLKKKSFLHLWPYGMEVGLGPGDFVFDGDAAIPRKKGTPTPLNFWPMPIVAKRLDG